MSASSRRAALERELRRVFNASSSAIMCLLSHGQVTIDGYVIRPHHLERWTPAQLRGRTACIFARQQRLF